MGEVGVGGGWGGERDELLEGTDLFCFLPTKEQNMLGSWRNWYLLPHTPLSLSFDTTQIRTDLSARKGSIVYCDRVCVCFLFFFVFCFFV